MATKNNKILFKNIKKRESMLINECVYEKKSYIELVKKKGCHTMYFSWGIWFPPEVTLDNFMATSIKQG